MIKAFWHYRTTKIPAKRKNSILLKSITSSDIENVIERPWNKKLNQ